MIFAFAAGPVANQVTKTKDVPRYTLAKATIGTTNLAVMKGTTFVNER